MDVRDVSTKEQVQAEARTEPERTEEEGESMSKWTIYDEGDLIMCNRYDARRQRDSLYEFWQVRLLPDAPDGKVRILFQTNDRSKVIKFFLKQYERSLS